MRKFWKTFLLIFLLAGWFFLYIFLKLFGKNEYQVPKMYAYTQNNSSDTLYYTIPQFSLRATDNSIIGLNNFNNNIYLVHFLPYNCLLECTIRREKIKYLSDVFVKYSNVKFLTCLLNTESSNNDFPFESTQNNWVIGSVENEEIKQITCETFKFCNNTNIADSILLVDVNGNIRGKYNMMNVDDYDRMVDELRMVIYEFE